MKVIRNTYVQLKGGLGNQMFQCAYGMSIAKKHSYQLTLLTHKLDEGSKRNYSLSVFPNINGIAVKTNSRLAGCKFLTIDRVEKSFSYHQNHFNSPMFKNIFLDGYWQSELYFGAYEAKIKELFSFAIPEACDSTKRILAEINDSSVTSMHIRRADYLDPEIRDIHGICSLEYYKTAMNLLDGDNVRFLVLSDDIEWCKTQFRGDKFIFPEMDDKKQDWEDMLLMSKCQNNIIANSSFSWWGAWLNNHANKCVIAPKNWFRDESINASTLIPQDWKTIDNNG